jgi:oxygen-independent coproporphyrinogen-3 oxidase
MWPYHPDLLETPVPRYTSYPTAADFGALEPTAIEGAIERSTGDVSLYLHIPFCEKICYYCGCNTGASGRRERVESYLAALHQEIAAAARLLPRSARVRRIAFGGGSPNAILPADFMALIEALHQHFPLANPEYSIELDPRTMDGGWARTIGEVGITRASMGVQTFAAHCQRAIGRIQSDELIERTTALLRENGVTSLNFDLMYGLPFQTHRDLAASLERTVALGADRIALFGYAHVPHIVKRQTVIDASGLPGPRERFGMAEMGFAYLTAEGYRPIGFDHFALPRDPMAEAAGRGDLRRNFQGFTDDRSRVLIGLGSSAISGFPDLLAQNEKNNGRYRMFSSQGFLSAQHGIARSPEDQQRSVLIERLLCAGSVEMTSAVCTQIRSRLEPFLARGLAALEQGTLTILPAGLPYARVIAALFDPYREATTRRFSSAI